MIIHSYKIQKNEDKELLVRHTIYSKKETKIFINKDSIAILRIFGSSET